MAAVKSKGTQLERLFFMDLEARGVTGTEQHPDDIYGKATM